MSRLNNIPKSRANRHPNKSQSAKGRRANRHINKSKLNEHPAKQRSETSQEIQVHFVDDAGNVVFDATGKKCDEFPDEIKAALRPAQVLFARVYVIGAWERFYNSLPPHLRDAYDMASKSDKQEVFRAWADTCLLNEAKTEVE
jgi:hypothetical protein